MFFASSYQTFNCYDRRVHDPQFAVAGEEGEPAEQEGHAAGHLVYRH